MSKYQEFAPELANIYKILWLDQNVESAENKRYAKSIRNLCYELFTFKTLEELATQVESINLTSGTNHENAQHLILITTGYGKGELLKKYDEEWSNLPGITITQVIIFCGNIQNNIQIKEKYPELIKHVVSSLDKLLEGIGLTVCSDINLPPDFKRNQLVEDFIVAGHDDMLRVYYQMIGSDGANALKS